MFKLDEAKLQAVLKQLHQAIYNHERWHNDLIRTIICQQPHDHHDMAKDAHRRCRFGQWYYNDVPTEVRDHQAFLAIRTEHKHMHQLATQLLATAATKAAIAPHDYDAFANALDRLRLEIQTLSREIEESLYNHDPLTGALNRMGALANRPESDSAHLSGKALSHERVASHTNCPTPNKFDRIDMRYAMRTLPG